ncbi:MAG: tRNA uridine-5-carboxymethylaminomethyl(34) synthesis GTPase MnmE [Elusimicrobiota bacterium]|jgi:tRNA modification GTPase|nr:tRNA uridine-5-carboxymethylaminomethyl(34) synthesis GTPase MnmE [Elusimicrobiota bacterium]
MFIFSRDTIAAFATASSSGAVALLRISGPQALDALRRLTRKDNFKARRATLVKIYDGAEVLDQAVAVVYAAPKSYTGQDVAEITLHASAYIKTRVLELLSALGVRPAKAGEFTMRAFMAGKMDLTQAQGVADIIAGKNKAAHKAAMNAMDGKLSQKFKHIKEGLSELLAQIEVRLDDTDEEMPPLDGQAAQKNLSAVMEEAQKLAATFCSGRLIKDGVKAAIAGVPNSGKSSLLNALLGFERAIVSEQSGTTRDTIEAAFNAGGYSVILTDTAGIREHALDAAEKEGMARSKKAVQSADIVIFVKDLNAQDSALQERLLKEISAGGKKVIEVINKADLLPQNFKDGLLISAKTGRGIDALKEEILKVTELSALQEDDILITSAAHYDALIKAAGELKSAGENLKNLELAAEHLRAALRALKELIGEVTTDNILDVIFSKFCVGK